MDTGCARCHAGLGAKPTIQATPAQLENVDCLVCHSPTYKRRVEAIGNGEYRLVPDAANMSVSVLQAAVSVGRPNNDTCLNCHARSGGGPNFKRGDLDDALRTPASTNVDVHMAPAAAGGLEFTCSSCHLTISHKVAGRGIDLPQRDLLDPVACTNCHAPQPHAIADLNKHTARVNCAVCHIPDYARQTPTEMQRDWSKPAVLNATTGLYEPFRLLASHQTPTYAFFNGKSEFYEFGTPAVPKANGKILMAGPLGKITDLGAQIVPLKRHDAMLPIDPATRWLLPMKADIFSQTGNLVAAVSQGAAEVGWNYTSHQFASAERYMGIFHGVAPRTQALACATCHDGNTRLNFAALGYTPLATRNGRPLCESCHSARTADFYKNHNKHVTGLRYNCSTCHTFSKAQ
jgi:hypothetical protein